MNKDLASAKPPSDLPKSVTADQEEKSTFG